MVQLCQKSPFFAVYEYFAKIVGDTYTTAWTVILSVTFTEVAYSGCEIKKRSKIAHPRVKTPLHLMLPTYISNGLKSICCALDLNGTQTVGMQSSLLSYNRNNRRERLDG